MLSEKEMRGSLSPVRGIEWGEVQMSRYIFSLISGGRSRNGKPIRAW